MAHSRFGAATRRHTYIYKNGFNSLLRMRQRNDLPSDGLSFVRGSTTICHSSATATDATSPTLPGKTAFWGNNRAVNGSSACLGDSGVTNQPNTSSVTASPTPATAKLATRSSPPIEAASENSLSPTVTKTPTARVATRSSPPNETASENTLSLTLTKTPTAKVATRTSPPT